MSALKQVAQGFKSIWGHAEDEEEYTPAEPEGHDTEPETFRDSARESRRENHDRYSSHTSHSSHTPSSNHGTSYGGGSSYNNHMRKLKPVANPLRSAREKNIYTLKPKSMDEATLAADYLKTGCAVVLNLDDVETFTAVRIIDFMSGVCYGLEKEGGLMKLGHTIFLFTPGDFEIASDEADYGANPDPIFKDTVDKPASSAPPVAPPAPSSGYGSSGYSGSGNGTSAHNSPAHGPSINGSSSNGATGHGSSSYGGSERRSWER